jgi:hypothetical protein
MYDPDDLFQLGAIDSDDNSMWSSTEYRHNISPHVIELDEQNDALYADDWE